MKRIYHPYNLWEEYHEGMWRIVSSEERKLYSEKAADLMKNTEKFENAMRKASIEWKFSCEHNLTDRSMNRIAWLGHAGCCIETGSPEDATRNGWWTLNEEEQNKANLAASKVLSEWEERYAKNKTR